jgi:EmrB/QacA subfamily drug resistance transporter
MTLRTESTPSSKPADHEGKRTRRRLRRTTALKMAAGTEGRFSQPELSGTPSKRRGGRRLGFSQRGTLAVVCLATAMLMLDIAVVNTALPQIASNLDSGLSGLQWVVDAYALGLATVVLTAGSLADRIGRRRMFVLGLGVFTITSLWCALATGIGGLDAARAVQGIGGAMMFASSLAILADAFPAADERAKAFAAYGATIGASFALGPLVGGALTSYISWRAVFFINIPLGLATLAATYLWMRESHESRTCKLDLPGQATLTVGLFLLVFALLRGNESGWNSAPIVTSLAAAGALLALFVAVEWRSRAPMLPLDVFRRPDFTGAQVATFAISGSFFALFLYMTLYLQEILHLSPIQAGLVYLPGTIAIFLVSGASAPLSTKVPPPLLVVAGLTFVAAGLPLLLLAGTGSSWIALMPALLMSCVGVGLFNPAVAAVALGSLAPEKGGLASGTNLSFRQGGVAVGVAVFGAVVPAASALGHGSATGYVAGMHTAAIIGAVLAGLAAVVTAGLFRLGLVSSSKHTAEAAVAVATS